MILPSSINDAKATCTSVQIGEVSASNLLLSHSCLLSLRGSHFYFGFSDVLLDRNSMIFSKLYKRNEDS